MKIAKLAVFCGAAASWTGYPSGRTRRFRACRGDSFFTELAFNRPGLRRAQTFVEHLILSTARACATVKLQRLTRTDIRDVSGEALTGEFRNDVFLQKLSRRQIDDVSSRENSPRSGMTICVRLSARRVASFTRLISRLRWAMSPLPRCPRKAKDFWSKPAMAS